MEGFERKKTEEREAAHLGHRRRLRERYLSNGYYSLDDREILELLLTYSIPRRDVAPIAEKLLSEFGSIKSVLNADPRELADRCGLSENSAALLSLVKDIIKDSFGMIEHHGEKLSSVRAAADYCGVVLSEYPEEAVIGVFLDSGDNIVDLIKLASGSSDAAQFPIGKIIDRARRKNASRVVLAHNHPSGNPIPSSADVAATEALVSSLRTNGLTLLEHFIVARKTCTAILHHQTIPISGGVFMPWKLPE